MRMNRGFTRTTWKPSRLSSAGRDGSWRDVTTVTSWPRVASSRERVRTWLSTPPRCGKNHGVTWAILTPAPQKIRLRGAMFPRACEPGPRNDSSPMIVPASIDALIPTFTSSPMITPSFRRPVEAEVRDFCPRPEIAAFPQDAVADVVLMGHVDAGHQDGVLHFTRVAHLRLWADRGRRPDVTVRADLGVGADDRRAFDVRTPPHARARFHEDLADEGRAPVHIGVVRPFQRREEGRVRAEKVPRPTDVNPFAWEAESVDVTPLHQRTNRVRNLVLPSR